MGARRGCLQGLPLGASLQSGEVHPQPPTLCPHCSELSASSHLTSSRCFCLSLFAHCFPNPEAPSPQALLKQTPLGRGQGSHPRAAQALIPQPQRSWPARCSHCARWCLRLTDPCSAETCPLLPWTSGGMTECPMSLTKGVSHSPALCHLCSHILLECPSGFQAEPASTWGSNCDARGQQEPGLQAGGRWAS